MPQLRFKGHAYAKPSGRGLILTLPLTPTKLNGSSGVLSTRRAPLGELEQLAGVRKCLRGASCAGTASRASQGRRYAQQGVKAGRKRSGLPWCPQRGDERAGEPPSDIAGINQGFG